MPLDLGYFTELCQDFHTIECIIVAPNALHSFLHFLPLLSSLIYSSDKRRLFLHAVSGMPRTGATHDVACPCMCLGGLWYERPDLEWFAVFWRRLVWLHKQNF